MKKFILFLFLFLLCGCGTVDEGIDDIKSTKLGLAKNSVSGYANAVKAAYTEYLYSSAMGTYEVLENSTVVNVDGSLVNLNVKYYDDNLVCSDINVINGSVKLGSCLIYDYEFMYDGQVIQK